MLFSAQRRHNCFHKCVSKTHIPQMRGCSENSVQYFRSLFKGNISVAHCMPLDSTQRIKNDVYVRLPNISLASCDLDL